MISLLVNKGILNARIFDITENYHHPIEINDLGISGYYCKRRAVVFEGREKAGKNSGKSVIELPSP
jgi:hypothetical protein